MNGLVQEEPESMDVVTLRNRRCGLTAVARDGTVLFFPHGGKDHDNRYTSDSGSNRFSCIIEARYYGDGRRIMGKSTFFRRALVSATLGTGTAGYNEEASLI